MIAMLLAGGQGSRLGILTKNTAKPAVRFGGKYRIIDFPLSNMVNAGISKVGVITKSNYRSLMDHIGTGKDWDLARRSGGIKILPPFITAYDAKATKVWVASPDQHAGAAQELAFTQENGYISLTLPSLEYWTMLVIE